MARERILAVDGNWILNRVHHTNQSSRPMEEVLPWAFVGLVLKDACLVKATHILVGFDGPAVFRYDIYPGYKASRSEKRAEAEAEEGYRNVYECLPALRKFLDKCGIQMVQHKKREADDVLCSAAHQYVEAGYEVVAAAQDKDGYQFLGPHVRMFDSSAKPEPKWITAEKAEKSKGVPVSKMVMYQTLLGDSIDDIPKILTPAKAKAVCLKYKSIKDWHDKSDKETQRFIKAHQAQMMINKQLVTLRADMALPDPATLKPNKVQLLDMPKSWYAHQDLCYPKRKGLFGK